MHYALTHEIDAGYFNDTLPNDSGAETYSISDEEDYVPSLDKVKNSKGWDSKKEMLFNKGRADIKEYLTDVVKGYSSIKGTEISVQDNGALLISNGGRDPLVLENLPKIKLDDDSGVLFFQIGNQKFQLNRKLIMSSNDNGITGTVGTNLSFINKYKNS